MGRPPAKEGKPQEGPVLLSRFSGNPLPAGRFSACGRKDFSSAFLPSEILAFSHPSVYTELQGAPPGVFSNPFPTGAAGSRNPPKRDILPLLQTGERKDGRERPGFSRTSLFKRERAPPGEGAPKSYPPVEKERTGGIPKRAFPNPDSPEIL